MTAYEAATLNGNGNALQLYIGVKLATDTGFPLAEGDDVFIHPVGTEGFLVLRQSALQSAYPIAVDEPPDPLQAPVEFDASTLNQHSDPDPEPEPTK